MNIRSKRGILAAAEDQKSEADTDCSRRKLGDLDSQGEKPGNNPSLSGTIDDNNQAVGDQVTQACFKHVHRNGRHFVYCGPCRSEPDTVKRYAPKGKIPPTTVSTGTVYRKAVTDVRVRSEVHKQLMKKQRLDSLSKSEIAQVSDMDKFISTVIEGLAIKIGSLHIQVYGDGKKLSLSANFFPMRAVTARKALSFSFNVPSQEARIDTNLQYVTPHSHLELLKCIVDSDRQALSQKIHDTIAISLRCDDSVDRTQVDKIYVVAKVITKVGMKIPFFWVLMSQRPGEPVVCSTQLNRPAKILLAKRLSKRHKDTKDIL